MSVRNAVEAAVLLVQFAIGVLLIVGLFSWRSKAVSSIRPPGWKDMLHAVRLPVLLEGVAFGALFLTGLAPVLSGRTELVIAFLGGLVVGIASAVAVSGLVMFGTRRMWRELHRPSGGASR